MTFKFGFFLLLIFCFSLLSKTTNNDPFQPMIQSFHAFLIRNDPVRRDRSTVIEFDFSFCFSLLRVVRWIYSNVFSTLSIPVNSIILSFNSASLSLMIHRCLLHLRSKVRRISFIFFICLFLAI
jgi:hypothetical protein